MSQPVKDPLAINYSKTGKSPASVLTDVNGVPYDGANPFPVTGSITATNPSVGVNGAVIPGSSTQVGGEDAGGNLRQVAVLPTDPVGTENGLVVRNIPSGIQDALVAGTGTAGVPAVGVVTVQGIVGGEPLPITGTISATNPSVGTNNAAIPTSSTQIGGSDGTNLQAARVFDADTGAGSQYVLGAVLRKSASGGSVEAGTSTDPLRIDPTGTTTQPISGTVTANAGSGNFSTNLAQYGGVAVGAANAIHVQPGTGATFTVAQSTAANLNATVVGSLTNNNAAPTTNNVGVLPAVANASSPTFTEGRQGLLSMDLNGYVRVTGARRTYAASTATFTPAAAATDIFRISGSGTTTVRILRIILSGTQLVSGNIATILLIKRSTANTGGTTVAATLVPYDSASAAATAGVVHYTANAAALGTSVGTIFAPRALVPATSTSVMPPTIMDWKANDYSLGATPIVLRGTAEGVSINMNATVPVGAANFRVDVVWTEE